MARPPVFTSSGALSALAAGDVWEGVYSPTHRPLRLGITTRYADSFSGILRYLDDGSVTAVEGDCVALDQTGIDRTLGGTVTAAGSLGIRFHETRITEDGRPPELEGEYVAIVSDGLMSGVWRSQGRDVGSFELRRAGH